MGIMDTITGLFKGKENNTYEFPGSQGKDKDELRKSVLEMYREARQHRKKTEKEWDKYYKFYRGDQWEQKPPAHRSHIVLNFIFGIIESEIPIITDNRPDADVRPVGKPDKEIAQILKANMERIWDENRMEKKKPRFVRDGCIYGDGWLKGYFDPELKEGLGDIAIDVCDPYSVYLDPFATGPEDCQYLLHVVKKPLSWVKAHYPSVMDGPEGLETTTDTGNRRQGRDSSGEGSEQITDSTGALTQYVKKSGYNSKIYEGKAVEVIEAWIKDYTVEDFEAPTDQTDENGQPVMETQQRYKYPKGRLVILAGGKVVDDKDFPYTRFSRPPFVQWKNYDVNQEQHGISEVDNLIPVQEEVNKRKAKMIDHHNLEANSPWIYAEGTVDPESLNDKPGQKIPVTKGFQDSVRRTQIPPLAADILASYESSVRAMEIISGISATTQGRRPAGVTAGTAIHALQEATESKIRMKARNLEYAVEEIGKIIIDLMLQFYTEERMFRTYDKATNTEMVGTMMVNTEEGKIYINGKPQFDIQDYDVRVRAGSMMMTDREAKTDLELTMFKIGLTDQQACLEGIDYPNKEAVLARMQAKNQAAMAGGMKSAKTDPEVVAKIEQLRAAGVPEEQIQAALVGGAPVPGGQ